MSFLNLKQPTLIEGLLQFLSVASLSRIHGRRVMCIKNYGRPGDCFRGPPRNMVVSACLNDVIGYPRPHAIISYIDFLQIIVPF